MKITIEYSAQIRRTLGVSEETIDLMDSQSLHDLILHLAEKHGQLFKDLILDVEGNLSRMILASVNSVQVQESTSVDLKDGKKVDVKMGSYGIGVSRLVGAIIEAKFNNNIMKWPNSVAPFEVAIIPSLQKNDKSNYLKAEKIYNLLTKNNIDVLFDDTDEHLSAKFKKFDLIGIPYQIILGSKSTDNKFEFKEINGETTTLSLEEIKNKLLNKRNLN